MKNIIKKINIAALITVVTMVITVIIASPEPYHDDSTSGGPVYAPDHYEIMEKHAKNGDTEAQFDIAMAYLLGVEGLVEKNSHKASIYFKKYFFEKPAIYPVHPILPKK